MTIRTIRAIVRLALHRHWRLLLWSLTTDPAKGLAEIEGK